MYQGHEIEVDAGKRTDTAACRGVTGGAIAASDMLKLPSEYEVQVLCRWGDTLESQTRTALSGLDGSTMWEEQAWQAGVQIEGMAFFAIDGNHRHGLLSINQSDTDDEPLCLGDMRSRSAEQVYGPRTSQGVRVIEIIERLGRWHVLPRFRSARPHKSSSSMDFGGASSDHSLFQSPADLERCVVTCSAFTPDRRFVFINVKHSGETGSERSDPVWPLAVSNGSDDPAGGRPRCATVVVRRTDGGAVGA